MNNQIENSDKIVQACTAEIKVHFIIFLSVIWPVTALVFPSIVLYFVIFALANGSVLFGLFDQRVPDFVAAQFMILFLTLIILLLSLYSVFIYKTIHKNRYSKNSEIQNGKKPAGKKGEELQFKVARLWSKFDTINRKVPLVKWFVNFNVLAHAYENNGTQQIHVSSGLWERVIKKDPLSEIILTHEIAHLIFKDGAIFDLLESFTVAVRVVIKYAVRLSITTTIILGIYQVITDFRNSINFIDFMSHLVAVLMVAFMLLLPMILGEMAIRRYGGFITSLMELRADISAALWTTGLKEVTKTLENDPSIRKSTLSDLGHSLSSLNLSHISESERIRLLKSPDRLSTPKLRYFALSILLALALPLNSITPLLWGGALDHLFVVTVIIAIYVATLLMFIDTQGIVIVSWKRCFILAAALCTAIGLSRINLYEFGYLLTAESASLMGSTAFNNEPFSFLQLKSNSILTVQSFLNDLLDIFAHLSSFISFVIVAASIRVISILSRKFTYTYFSKYIKAILTALLSFIILLVTYDPWRGTWFEIWPLSISKKINEWTEIFPGIRFSLPILFMLIICICFYLISIYRDKFIRKKIFNN